MEELQAIYRQALPAHIAKLEAARSAGDTDAARVRRIAHSLRGSGGTYGFAEISAAAARVEDASGAELSASVDRLIELLRAVAAGA